MYSYGNNFQISGVAFENRKFYDKQIIPIFSEKPSSSIGNFAIDMFMNKPFYGRIDTFSNSVFSGLKKQIGPQASADSVPVDDSHYMKNFPSTNLYAMNFIVDAFQDMSSYFNTCCKMLKNLSKTGPFSRLVPVVGWFSPVDQYYTFINKVYNFYLNKHFIYEEPKRIIKDYKLFHKSFTEFLIKNSEDFSIIYSIFNLSKFNHPATSGLIVEVALDNHGDDYIKTSQYISDINFAFFKQTAARFGFYIDRNVPWRLIANITSENMRDPYMKRYGVSNINELFNKQFIKSYTYDIFFLREAYVSVYLLLCQQFPTYSIDEYSQCLGEILKEYPREVLDLNIFYKKYTDVTWLDTYITLLDKNSRQNSSQDQLENIKNDIKSTFLTKGLDKALTKCNEYFKNYGNFLINQDFLTEKFGDVIIDPLK